jgi:pimeloyl-ACP methyl ester carboxylesterase
MTLVEANGIQLDCQITGTHGPLVTYVHGALVGMGSWRHQVGDSPLPRRLASRTLVFDQRGYGSSSRPPKGYSIETTSEDIAGLWAALEIDRSFVVGFSFGGFVALDLARRCPDQVQGLVLESCGMPTPGLRRMYQERSAALGLADPSSEVLAHVERVFSSGYTSAHPEEVAWYGGLAATAYRPAVAATFECLAGWQPQGLADLDGPKLVINGSEDLGFGATSGRALAHRLPDCRHAVIDHAGHTAHFEDPQRFNALLDAFLEDHWCP